MSDETGLALWAHSVYQFGDEEQMSEHADRIAGAGVDILIPCVKNPPGVVDFFTDAAEVNPDYPDWDPLKVLIDECNQRGVKVHPWFCVFPEGEQSRLLNRHPEYAAEFDGDRRWACACRKEVQNHVVDLYRSLAERYKPDGLHLDYIRTGGECRCDRCWESMVERGFDIREVPFHDPGYQQWIEWRIDNVSSVVARVRQITDEADMELSAAVFTDYPACRQIQGQDWVEWGREGLVDYLFPMNYTNSLDCVRARADCHSALVGDAAPFWEGLGKRSSASRLSTDDLGAQIRASLGAGASGVVIFQYPALTDEDLRMLEGL